MTGVRAVQDAVVESLQRLTGLVDAVGTAEAITGFDPEVGEFRTASEAVRGMTEATVMVTFEGLEEAPRGEIPRWRYSFNIVLFAPGDFNATVAAGVHPGYFGMLEAIIDGIDPITGQRWLDSPIHVAFDPPAELRFSKLMVDGAEIWLLAFSLMEIGG